MNTLQITRQAQTCEAGRVRLFAPWLALAVLPLAGMTDVKIGPVQVAELYVELFSLVLAIPLLSRSGRNLVVAPKIFAVPFKFLMIALLIGAFLSLLRGDLVVPSQIDTIFKRPGWISLSRVVQLLIGYFCFSLIASYIVRSRAFFRRAVGIYLFSALMFSVYGILSYCLLVSAGVNLGGAYGDEGIRLRALFVEGGPFGLYAISALILAFAQRACRLVSRRFEFTCYLTIGAALILSGSKAAAVALAFTVAISLTISRLEVIRRHLLSVVAVAAVAAGTLIATRSVDQLGVYVERRSQLIEAGEQFKDDPNIVMGRIAAAVIVPNMVAEHPLVGIGIGNYSLLRDNAIYRSGLPAVDDWDLHGLGIAGLTAEIGVIGVGLLVWTFSASLRLARRRRVPLQITFLCVYPLMALVFGAQPTFLYPWIISALSFGFIAYTSTLSATNGRSSRTQMAASCSPGRHSHSAVSAP